MRPLLLLLVALCCAANGQSPTSTIEFRADATAGSSGTLVLRSVREPARTREVAITGSATVLAEPDSEWEVSLRSNDWWSLPQTVRFPLAGVSETRSLDLFALTTVGGRVIAGDKDVRLPTAVTLSVESPPHPVRPHRIPRGTEFQCPVEKDGTWSCRVPAVVLDLSLRAVGMTPHYRWDVTPVSGKPVSLGTFVLRNGASLTAWLDRDFLQTLEKPARVALLRAVAKSGAGLPTRLDRPVAETRFDGRGMAHLAPVPPGMYVLEVSAAGYAPVRVGPVEVFEGAESEFRKPIELQRPVPLTIAIEPALDPNRSAWRIRLAPVGNVASAATGTDIVADENGLATVAGQAPGTWYVTVQDRDGNKVWHQSYSIRSEADAAIRIKLNLLRVNGVVRLGADPLEASLWFGGRNGAERARLHSDTEGAFVGMLPRGGPWLVEVESTNPPVRTVSRIFVIEDEPITITLPDTQVSGWAVRWDGVRVSTGTVVVTGTPLTYTTSLQSDGTFSFRGLPAGEVQVSVLDRETGERSRPVAIQLADGRRIEGLELRTEPVQTVSGQVTAQGRPVVGARVVASAHDIPSRADQSATTDMDGHFKVHLPAAARRALVIVHAPGRTLQGFLVPLAEEPLSLDVASVGGTLEIVSTSFRLTQNGISLPLSALLQWIAAHGQDPLRDVPRFVIPDLAAGHYEACVERPSPTCKSGTLVPGGTLRLEF